MKGLLKKQTKVNSSFRNEQIKLLFRLYHFILKKIYMLQKLIDEKFGNQLLMASSIKEKGHMLKVLSNDSTHLIQINWQ